VGIAFQIKDDLFDYQSGGVIGKPTGIDIKERKMTLPLIYTLSVSSRQVRNRIIDSVRNHNNNTARVEEVLKIVRSGDGLLYAEKKMHALRDEALALLAEMPKSIYLDSFSELIRYTVDRKK
jgi:octaprenyl-diphosphate synthase